MSANNIESLELESVIGFAGNVAGSLILHNDDTHILYALGSTVVVKHLIKNEQYFLQCGSAQTAVSCMKLSNDGKLLATGQKTHAGFPASVWVWNLAERKVIHKLDLYKTKIQAISFSPSNRYIATLGGEDDNKLVIWNAESGDAICGSPAANDTAFCCSFSNTDDHVLVTAGKYNVRVWQFEREARKIRPSDCKLGQIKRVFNCIAITADDETMFAGTQSGDILQISLKHQLFQAQGPNNCKKPFSMGVQSIALSKDGEHIIAGAGNGVVALLSKSKLELVRSVQFEGEQGQKAGAESAPKGRGKGKGGGLLLRQKKVGSKLNPSITSIALNRAGDHFFVGTNKSTMYLVAMDDFDFELRNSAHYKRINDVVFPAKYSELFVTAGVNDLRVWNIRNRHELLRINVPNLECHCVILSQDGKSIVSGWNDGKVRAFYPETGRLMYTVHDCHSKGVTAIAISADGQRLVTGGNDSLVRIWSLSKDADTDKVTSKMLSSLREHQNAISHIAINRDDTEFVTASHDGSCVIWDLVRCQRINALFSSTQFLCVVYHPDESQLITTGTDRQISYWDSTDLSQIRIVNGSDKGALNKLAINAEGTRFVSCSEDRVVKLWGYDEGRVHCHGLAHSGNVTAVCISPDNTRIVSVGDEGAICIWKMPKENKENAQISGN